MVRKSGRVVPFLLLGLASLGSALNENDQCTNPAGQSGRCIYFRECDPLLKIYSKPIISPDESQFVENSRCGMTADRKPLVCCAVSIDAGPRSQYSLPKPPNCGVDFQDRIVGGQRTGLDEFPWTGLIEYRKPNGRTGFHCGASLINSRYVLTAGHCIKAIPNGWEVIGVRLGEWDLDNAIDCQEDNNCADAPVNLGVEKIIVHEDYNPSNKAQYNDIALIRFNRDVRFSAFISPVCLPIENAQRTKNNVGTRGVATGWGRTETASASNVKLKVELEIQDLQSCANTYRPSGVTLRDTQFCAGGVRGQDTCSGDSGGPLTKLDRANNYLYGIVSFGPNKCGTKGVPGVYTSVAKYVNWIEANI